MAAPVSWVAARTSNGARIALPQQPWQPWQGNQARPPACSLVMAEGGAGLQLVKLLQSVVLL